MNINEKKALTWATVAMRIKDLGYKYIAAYFDGSGDSGYVERIVVWNSLEDLENNFTWDIVSGVELSELNLEDKLQKFISDEFDEISGSEDDWWNNAGGSGKCIIDLSNNKYDLDIDVNIQETVNYHYEKKLID